MNESRTSVISPPMLIMKDVETGASVEAICVLTKMPEGVLESMFNFISRLFVSYFRVDFCLFYAGDSGLFSNSTDKNMPKRATKSPKQV